MPTGHLRALDRALRADNAQAERVLPDRSPIGDGGRRGNRGRWHASPPTSATCARIQNDRLQLAECERMLHGAAAPTRCLARRHLDRRPRPLRLRARLTCGRRRGRIRTSLRVRGRCRARADGVSVGGLLRACREHDDRRGHRDPAVLAPPRTRRPARHWPHRAVLALPLGAQSLPTRLHVGNLFVEIKAEARSDTAPRPIISRTSATPRSRPRQFRRGRDHRHYDGANQAPAR